MPDNKEAGHVIEQCEHDHVSAALNRGGMRDLASWKHRRYGISSADAHQFAKIGDSDRPPQQLDR